MERSINEDPLRYFPGFRFSPTDEELITNYLKKKLQGIHHFREVIAEVEIWKYEPWDLPDKAAITSTIEWFFFSPRGRKYPNGSQSRRATDRGYWKATGKERYVKVDSNPIGTKRTLVFHLGRAPKGERTEWLMHEYCVLNKAQDSMVICRLKKNPDFRVNAKPRRISVNRRHSSSSSSSSSSAVNTNKEQINEGGSCSNEASCSNFNSGKVKEKNYSGYKSDDKVEDCFADIMKDDIINLDNTSLTESTPQLFPMASQAFEPPQFLSMASQGSEPPRFLPMASQAYEPPQFLPMASQASELPQFLPMASQASESPQFLPMAYQASVHPQFLPMAFQASELPQFLLMASQGSEPPRFMPMASQGSEPPQFLPMASQASEPPLFLPMASQRSEPPQSQGSEPPEFLPMASQLYEPPQFLPMASQASEPEPEPEPKPETKIKIRQPRNRPKVSKDGPPIQGTAFRRIRRQTKLEFGPPSLRRNNSSSSDLQEIPKGPTKSTGFLLYVSLIIIIVMLVVFLYVFRGSYPLDRLSYVSLF